MRYSVDNDLHIHSYLSPCSGDDLQTPENILKYAIDNSLEDICLTDHFWDSCVPGATPYLSALNTERLKRALPLPKAKGINFMFGCETELDRYGNLAIGRKTFKVFDFVVIPINHFHMKGFTLAAEDFNNPPVLAKRWIERFDGILNRDLPFGKIGMAHLACELMVSDGGIGHIDVLDCITDSEYARLFSKAARLGVGIELNFETFFDYGENELKRVMRPFAVAKSVGCKFYFGSDAHHPQDFLRAKEKFEETVRILGLEEKDKFKVNLRSLG